MDYTLTGLLAEARRRGSIPNTSATGSADADLVAHLNEALIEVAAEVIKCREGFYRRYKDHTLSSTQTRYRIPTRALGNRLAAVLLLDSAGNMVGKLNELTYDNGLNMGSGSSGDTVGYYLEAGDIVLAPGVSTSSTPTLRMVYYVRPGQLTAASLDVASGNCFTVTGVAGNVLTIASSHGITTSTRIDVLKAGAPHEHLTTDELPSATASTTVTIADGSRVEIGDFVCLADKAPVCQVPDAFLPVVMLMAAQMYWAALDDESMAERMEMAVWGDGKRRPGAMKQAVALISPRVEDGARKIMSPHGVLGR